MTSSRQRLIAILEAISKKEFSSPGDIANETGLPRYIVLAAFQCLEALGVLEVVYSKGNHKLYVARPIVADLLKALREDVEAPILTVLKQKVPEQAVSDAA